MTKARDLLRGFVEGSYDQNYGRDIVASWARDCILPNPAGTARILDIGAGRGEDTVTFRTAAAGRPAPRGNRENSVLS